MDDSTKQNILIISESPKVAGQFSSLLKEELTSSVQVNVIDPKGFKTHPMDEVDLVIILSREDIGPIESLIDQVNSASPDVPIMVFADKVGLSASKELLSKGALKVASLDALPKEIITSVKEAMAMASKGHISGVGLSVALQMLELERKTCTLTCRSGDKRGYLFFKNGELINAQTGDKKGLDAAMEIVGWESAELEFRNFCKSHRRTIDTPLAFILLEASRQQDELAGEEGRKGHDDFLHAPQVAEEIEIPGIEDLDFEIEPERDFDFEAAMQEGPLKEPFHRILKALAKAIGPIATTVFKQNTISWAKDMEPSEENLDQLIDLLCVEIEDEDLIQEFRKELGL